jgi:hypothetical protein
MGIISNAVDISDLKQRNLWVIWGKSNSGKTKVGATFPKPMLYVGIGDDGSNTIKNVDGIKAVECSSTDELKKVAEELQNDKKYATVLVDTFSMITSVWIDQNAVQKKKKMTQNMWGDLKVETEELIRLFHKAARNKIVILTCHETMDTIEGMEEEILPDIRPSVTKGARAYLEGMANYGIHTTKIEKTVVVGGVEKEVVKYGAHLGANPYYWTKLQIDSSINIPKVVINPTYAKLNKLINGGE